MLGGTRLFVQCQKSVVFSCDLRFAPESTKPKLPQGMKISFDFRLWSIKKGKGMTLSVMILLKTLLSNVPVSSLLEICEL